VNCYGLFVYATKGDESFTNMTAVSQYEDRRKNARALYEQYGKPLEAEHKGEYVVISNSGKTIVGKSLTEAVTTRLDGIDSHLDNLDAHVGRIEADVHALRDEMVHRREFEDVLDRVKYIEKKLGIESGV
jgi:hypothetical protein